MALAALFAALAACGEPQPTPPTNATASAATSAAPFIEAPGKLTRFHSKRYALSVPLPDGKAWDMRHSPSALIGKHAPTRSRLEVLTFTDPELTSRQVCEARAREKKLVPQGELRTVEEQTVMAPEMFDTRVWVAIEPSAGPSKPVTGHVFAFGGFLRKCLFFHFASEVDAASDESVLSSRLALARTRILGGLTLDAFAEPPRDTLPTRRARAGADAGAQDDDAGAP